MYCISESATKEDISTRLNLERH
uniref:Uncharacterized protein n=1 Tax=Arundo donax TaxID=35708 RepID=A0A0A8YK84_ARUDO